MVGMPQQSFASVKETAHQAIALLPDIARIYPLLVIKDTPLAQTYAQGLFVPLSLDEAVTQAAWLYKELTQAGIKVIRIGLQADEELCAEGNILAGPFHPAMGELVKSRVLRDELTPRLLEQANIRQTLTLHCPARLESKLRGQKNCNLHYWQQLLPDVEIKIVPSEGEEISL